MFKIANGYTVNNKFNCTRLIKKSQTHIREEERKDRETA